MYRVEWLQSTLDELVQVWTAADSARRQAITAASHTIDLELRNDSTKVGESRPGGRRITFIPSLAITFKVDSSNQIVTILHFRLFRRRS